MAAIHINDASFDKVEKGKGVALVDFWAVWCTPCKIVGPYLDQLADEYKGKASVLKLNVDENPETAGKYGVMSIPTVITFKDGKPLKATVGAQSKDSYKKLIDEALAS